MAIDAKQWQQDLFLDLASAGGTKLKTLSDNTRAILANIKTLREETNKKIKPFIPKRKYISNQANTTVVATTGAKVTQALSLDALVQTSDHVRSLSEDALSVERFILSWKSIALLAGLLSASGLAGYWYGKRRNRKRK